MCKESISCNCVILELLCSRHHDVSVKLSYKNRRIMIPIPLLKEYSNQEGMVNTSCSSLNKFQLSIRLSASMAFLWWTSSCASPSSDCSSIFKSRIRSSSSRTRKVKTVRKRHKKNHRNNYSRKWCGCCADYFLKLQNRKYDRTWKLRLIKQI